MKKLLPKILGFAAIDFVVIWIWIKQINPDPSVAIYIIFLVPLVFGINLILAFVFYFIKKDLAKVFLINSVVSAVLMYFLFGRGIGRYLNERNNDWQFYKGDTTFTVSLSKKSDLFSITYSYEPDMSVGFLYGKFESKNNEFILMTDSTKYIIRNNYLIGFRNELDSLKLKKIRY